MKCMHLTRCCSFEGPKIRDELFVVLPNRATIATIFQHLRNDFLTTTMMGIRAPKINDEMINVEEYFEVKSILRIF